MDDKFIYRGVAGVGDTHKVGAAGQRGDIDALCLLPGGERHNGAAAEVDKGQRGTHAEASEGDAGSGGVGIEAYTLGSHIVDVVERYEVGHVSGVAGDGDGARVGCRRSSEQIGSRCRGGPQW